MEGVAKDQPLLLLEGVWGMRLIPDVLMLDSQSCASTAEGDTNSAMLSKATGAAFISP